ncbi:MAG: alpha-2-macroglobulin family protein [Rhizobiales bacterium]|nr:alpha-2-macroglobulin family protein [Hyphomicrobiales bacterium]
MAALPAGAEAAERQVTIVKDADFFGFDLRTETNVSLKDCQSICVNDKACKAFTYNPKVKWCFLKSDFGPMNSFPGAVAGKIVEPDAERDIGPAPAQAFISKDLQQQARDARDAMVVADDQMGQGASSLAAVGMAERSAGNLDRAVTAFKSAIAIDKDNADLWIELTRTGALGASDTDIARQAPIWGAMAYSLSRTTTARAAALTALAQAFAANQTWRSALNAYKASLAVKEDAGVRAAYVDLRARQGFRVVNHTIDTDSATPRACVEFSEPLVKADVDYSSFVTLNGAAPQGLEAKGSQICIEGLAHGERYKIALRPGLPSSVDENLENAVDLDIYVRDRSASVRFTGENFVLPGTARRGIPIVSVNTTGANLKLYRIGDRNIASVLTNSQFLTQMDGYNAQRIEDELGEMVWQGSIDFQTDLNKDVITSFPVDEALPQRKPGVYVLTAAAIGDKSEYWDAKATQWFVVSDIGLTTYAGTDGLNVFARSLDSARPIAGVELQLLAKNNEVLGDATTDADGRAVFTAGLIRGNAAMAPAVLTAQGQGQDFVFLDMTRAGFDLSDRGVTGRATPGAIDLLTWTERGIYRAGETVHASALARDNTGAAIENLPLTFIVSRPDGVEDRRIVENTGTLGGYAFDIAMLPNAMRGTWTMRAYTDPKAQAIAEKQFLVEDFIPDRIEFDLKSEAKSITVGTPAEVELDGRYLYGAPAAGLQLEGDVALKRTRTDDKFKGYQFGLADEEAEDETRIPLEGLPDVDEAGKAAITVDVTDVPSTTQLLTADVTVRMREPGGRAVERKLSLPVQSQEPAIGIKPEFDGELGENSIARFHVISVDTAGNRQSASGLQWTLLSIQRNYQWYRDGNSWRYEPVTTTSKVAGGRVDATTDGAEISAPVGWGRYRLEVETAAPDGPQSSVEFDAGWYVEAKSTETPDGLEIALDKEAYKPGETARLKVSPRFAGELLVTIGAENLVATKLASIPAEGGEVDLPVTADWGAGAYVTATLYRPGAAQESRMPMRAIGLKWLTVDPGDRKLAVSLGAPEKILPRGELTVPVQVTGVSASEETYVTVAAVDVGILNLTRYQPPDPESYYFGQRMLGLEIRDIYGRLIDGSLGAMGRIRTGGDGGQGPLNGSPPTEKLVAFFSGPVKLDAEGKANATFDIPQFNGTVRLMAVAWSKHGVGHGTQDVIVRDPVVVTASVPKFLAPGDLSDLRIDIANTDAPAGDYQLQVTSSPVVTVDPSAAQQTLRLEAGGKANVTLPLMGGYPGDGQITIRLTGADGASFEQALSIPVRPATLPVTTRRVVNIAANSSLTVNGELLADSILQGAAVSVNVTRSTAFDIPALLMSLDRYPYGCAEQTTSRALPLLYFSELAKQTGLADDDQIHKRVQDAIQRVLSYQSSTGSFGLWAPGSGDLWLDAYVTDFLTRAREQKYDVPETALVAALENLQNALGYDMNISERGNEMAYAVYVLARNRKAAISDLRYYGDTAIDQFPTPLAKAHIAAALALYGDVPRSRTIFAKAANMSTEITNVSLSRSDYGSALRDDAAVLALAAETRPVPEIIPEMSRVVAKEWDQKRYTSTQEQTWMLLAARAAQDSDKSIKLSVNGESVNGGYRRQVSGDALMENPLAIANRSGNPVSAVVTTVAAPAQPLPAGGDGFAIERSYYTLDGEAANVSEARQNERYVVVLKVTEQNSWASRILITDLLPAGFEIDNPSLVDSAQLANFEWIGEQTAAHTEFRSDRFVAAYDRADGDKGELTLAYVVRAVTPGTYDHPAASVEDMYRPQFSARTATGRMEVLKAE